MSTFIWMIVGIILLAITIFVHKHTYWIRYREEEHKMPLPIWLFILMVITALVPVINVAAFAFGLIAYCIYRGDPPYDVTPYFRCELRWWRALIGLLTKEV